MSDQSREIRVAALARVEGEGGLTIRLSGGAIEAVELQIYEPPRFFEAFLRGRSVHEVCDIVARICGICPVAYQMSAVHALENALGVTISPEIRRLRRLLYCGEWIESHALHIHLLNAPDFLGCGSGLEMAEHHPDEVRRGLRLKKHGNQLLETLGGRAIHPINVALGGFYRLPTSAEFAAIVPDFEWGLEAAVETARWVASFDFPDFACDYPYVSLLHPEEYPFNAGEIACRGGATIAVEQFSTQFAEEQVPHSTALQARRRSTGQPYFVGPLARIHHNFDRLSPRARQTAAEVGLDPSCANPYRGIVARAIEVIHAYEEALAILRSYRPPREPRVPFELRAGAGCWATEAPRGLLYHRFEIDEAGTVLRAEIIPPTSQNQAQIEQDLRHWLPRVIAHSDAVVARSCENLIRAYDPCISCSTHFLRVRWEGR